MNSDPILLRNRILTFNSRLGRNCPMLMGMRRGVPGGMRRIMPSCGWWALLAMVGLGWLLGAMGLAAAEEWVLDKPGIWARDGNSVTLARENSGWKVVHTGERDWSLHGFPRIEVKTGDIFEMTCTVRTGGAAGANVETGIIVRDAKGKELDWCYGGVSAGVPCDRRELKSRFIIPQNAATIEPRLIGHGPVTVWAEEFRLRRDGSVRERARAGLPAATQIEAGVLRLTVDSATGGIGVTDTRTGREWQPGLTVTGWSVLDAVPSPDRRSLALTLLNAETVREMRAEIALSATTSEFEVTLTGAGPQAKALDYPPPFATRPGDRLIVPANEGMGYPSNEAHEGLYRLIAYGGHGLCMGFFGVAEDATGAGWMAMLETPDDAAMNAFRNDGGQWLIGPSWDPQRGETGYPRKVRYGFFDKGGHVAMCKRYRTHAKQTGLWVPFTEKVKRNPNIDRLIGAANIWRMGGGGSPPADFAREMQALGMDRLLWSADGSAGDVKALRGLPGVLVGRYDIYQDIMDPAKHDQIGYIHGDWVTEAFPHDINWRGPAGDWRRGWEVRAKDGSMIPCAVICDSKALPYASKRIAAELLLKPYTARFIDTTVAAPWFECYHPDHPMTRSQSREWKMKLLKLVGDLGLVCGSETGHEASVPFCDYFEGMLSVGPYRVPDAGRDMLRIWDQVPERVAKYQVGEGYRLPLWELVYHDCVVAQWYWGDYNNKLPSIWRKRDLFNALYGTPPMYLFDAKQWVEKKDRFVASYRVAQPVARATGYAEMTDHRILTPDRTVQQSVFANGVTVTVNFGGKPYRTPEGADIPAMDLRITGLSR